jgi:hypothetical protein
MLISSSKTVPKAEIIAEFASTLAPCKVLLLPARLASRLWTTRRRFAALSSWSVRRVLPRAGKDQKVRHVTLHP